MRLLWGLRQAPENYGCQRAKRFSFLWQSVYAFGNLALWIPRKQAIALKIVLLICLIQDPRSKIQDPICYFASKFFSRTGRSVLNALSSAHVLQWITLQVVPAPCQ